MNVRGDTIRTRQDHVNRASEWSRMLLKDSVTLEQERTLLKVTLMLQSVRRRNRPLLCAPCNSAAVISNLQMRIARRTLHTAFRTVAYSQEFGRFNDCQT